MATPLWQLRIDRIVDAMRALDAEDIRRGAELLRTQSGQPSHEVAWWKETMFVDRELRRARRSRDAVFATRRAIDALEGAATRAGLAGDDADVACIAEALRSLTRATVVGYADPFGADVLGLGRTMPRPSYLASPAALPHRWTARRSA